MKWSELTIMTVIFTINAKIDTEKVTEIDAKGSQNDIQNLKKERENLTFTTLSRPWGPWRPQDPSQESPKPPNPRVSLLFHRTGVDF